MAIIADDGDEVKALARELFTCLEEIRDLNKSGQEMVWELAQTSNDKFYKTAEAIVREVASIMIAGLPDCVETADKVNAYSDFLLSMPGPIVKPQKII